MRVLHVVDRLSERGGAYRHMLGVLEWLAREHEIHLCVGRVDGPIPPGCRLTVVPGLEARVPQPVDLDPVRAAFGPDVIHVHTVVNPVALEWAADRGALMTVQDHRYFCPGRGKWTAGGRVCQQPLDPELCAGCFEDPAYFAEIWALTARRLAVVRRLRLTVLSQYMRRELEDAGVAAGRITVIPPFVQGLEAGPGPEAAPCVLFVGRLTEAKGALDAAEAWRRSGGDLPLVVAGTGRLRTQLQAAGAEVLGWVPHAALGTHYRRARVVLMPSRWQEPFGIVGLEALSLGTPVAAWDSGGIREWHPGEGLVAWGDIDGLAQAIRTLPGKPAVSPLGFDREPLMRRLLAVYGEIAGA